MRPHLIPVLPLSLTFACGDGGGPLEGVWAYEPDPDQPTSLDPVEVERDDGCVIRDEHRLAFDGAGQVFAFEMLTARCEGRDDGYEGYAAGVGVGATYVDNGDGSFVVPIEGGIEAICERTDDALGCAVIRSGGLQLRFRALATRRSHPPWEQ